LSHPLLLLSVLSITALLSLDDIAIAAGAKIARVAFQGTNAALKLTISGSGFGLAPPGVPCTSCSTPFIQMGGRIGCFDSYNIVFWSQETIILSGVQANPDNTILVAITNPQDKTVGTLSVVTPRTIGLSSPKIRSVTFAGSRKNLNMAIVGSGFGTAPPGVPGEFSFAFFSFIDLPLDSSQWQAGYAGCGTSDAVALDYALWSNTKILISGFGREYGRGPRTQHNKWIVTPGDLVAIAVANSGKNGLKIGYSSNPTAFGSPLGTGAVWVGQLP
jgi:hypothetical protein